MKATLPLILILLAGCASMKVVPPIVPAGQQAVPVLVYRESAFNAGGGSMYFGEGSNYYLSLSNGEYGEVELPPGSHRFLVTNRGSQDFVLDVKVEAQGRTCLKAYANPANYAKTLIPLLMNLTSLFILEPVPCPSEDFLKSYTKVAKT